MASAVTATSSRYFEVEVDGAYVADAAYVDLASEISYTYKSPTPDHTHTIRVRERASARGETEFSAWVSATERCPRFVPTGLRFTCSSFGVVTVSWDAVPGADAYALEGPIHYSEGSPDHTTMNAQRLEGQTIAGVKVKARAESTGMWSDPSDEAEAVTCKERNTLDWNSPNVEDPPPRWIYRPGASEGTVIAETISQVFSATPTVFAPILVSRDCTVLGTVRTCAETWSENIRIRLDSGASWQDVALQEWDSVGGTMRNIGAIGGAAATLAGLITGVTPLTAVGLVFLSVSGAGIVASYIEEDTAGRYYGTMFGYSHTVDHMDRFQVDFSDAEPDNLQACLSDAGYQQATPATLDRITEVTGAYTNHRDITVHYCNDGS